eukprot:gnl/TRDRNA2_/TRDRNA2_109146_c0_seq1.p1 gnl/TRDRNA2_/TRDRNA2_109146_c0~~gnl/TRDRNA2_/TRDRNA2_109146_c0_seq1.p1  ORF type:complete len:481 (+),score=77.24 gnl/TRDRNA2_/TRDRNA2_109146_c0_seq1:191-1444(+)
MDAGDAEARADWSIVRQAGSSHVEVFVVGFGGEQESSTASASSVQVHRRDGCAGGTALLMGLAANIVYMPSKLLEAHYYVLGPPVRLWAERGALVVLSISAQQGGSSSPPCAEAILRILGCRVAMHRTAVNLEGEEPMTVLCAQGILQGEDPCGPAGAAALPHQRYVTLRRALGALEVDFRPLLEESTRGSVPAAAEAARRAWLAMDASEAVAAVAAGVTAGESALAMLPPDCDGNSRIQAAVSWGVRGSRQAGASESRAAAVGALLGLQEGLYTWDLLRPLDLHGISVADVVGTTLASEGVWSQSFSQDVRRRKISDLIRAGGLERPGECTIALCQALLGVNRPEEGKRLVAGISILRAVSQILLLQASKPNLLEEKGTEVIEFCNTVLESLNMVRLKARLRQGDEHEAQLKLALA